MRNSVHDLLIAYGLGRIATVLERDAYPSIRLTAHTAHEDEIAIGRSKFGGSPDLPIDYVWPHYNGSPVSFIAQINLSEISRDDLRHTLPPSGILHFFFDNDRWFEPASREDQGLWHISFIEDADRILYRTPLPLSHFIYM